MPDVPRVMRQVIAPKTLRATAPGVRFQAYVRRFTGIPRVGSPEGPAHVQLERRAGSHDVPIH